MRRKRVHTVATLVYNGVSPFEFAVACEVFGLDRRDVADPWYKFKVCAAEPGPLRASTGFTIQPDHDLDDLRGADTVIVPGWSGVDDPVPEDVLDALRAAHRRGARMVSVCSGAFVLAAAGLLDGRPATTHWMYAGLLAERYPAVKVDCDVLYVDDGDVLTSAGTAAGIDLCLHLVRLDHGAEAANAVARRMVVPPHRDGGQAQYVDAPMSSTCEDECLGDVLAWMMEHLSEPLTVQTLARRAGMSGRTFARRFRAVTGTTPHQWVMRQRILLAERLLETTDDPIERVATNAGFGSAAGMRSYFQRWRSTSPRAYRRLFQQTVASDG